MCPFHLNGKSQVLLNEALQVLDMKEVHLMTFCPTRMAYLLTACSQANMKELFLKNFLQLLDGDNGLIIECH